jgi:hypothetical protein
MSRKQQKEKERRKINPKPEWRMAVPRHPPFFKLC